MFTRVDGGSHHNHVAILQSAISQTILGSCFGSYFLISNAYCLRFSAFLSGHDRYLFIRLDERLRAVVETGAYEHLPQRAGNAISRSRGAIGNIKSPE